MSEQEFWDASLVLVLSVPVSGIALAVGGLTGVGWLAGLGAIGLVGAPLFGLGLAISGIVEGEDD